MSAGRATLSGVRFPGRYLQGPGALSRLGAEIAGFAPGAPALVLVDRGVHDLISTDLTAALGDADALVLQHAGECSEAAIGEAAAAARGKDAGVLVGIGGGKALDTAKAAAHEAGLPVVVVPTIAASDAPCSALAVVYHDDGTVAYDRFLPRNPDLVLADTALIARAPARFLAAGIGDALATFYEAEACRRSGAANCLGMPGLPLAYEIARFCRDSIFDHGATALAECDADTVGPAMERVVEANILLSGIGFQSGGVAAAHAIHHGLTELDEVHGYLHGEKVAIGVLAGLLIQGDEAEFARVRAFCAEVRLPVRLGDIGLVAATDADLLRIAERACRPGEIIHNEPMPVTPQMVVAALARLK